MHLFVPLMLLGLFRNRFNYTALFYAANFGHLEVLNVLMKHGADVLCQDATDVSAHTHTHTHTHNN